MTGRIIRVRLDRFEPEERRALITALISKDSDEVSRLLDSLLVFEGVVGSIIERIDGPILDGLSELLVGVVGDIVANRLNG